MPRRSYGNLMDSKLLMASYGKWMEDLAQEGFRPYFLSFTFKHIPGSSLSVEKVMRDEVERVYSLSLTRLFRYPHSPANREHLPRWIGCPDYPVGKGLRSSFRDVSVNAGRHVHVIAMIYLASRLNVPFHLHLLEQTELYVRAPLHCLDAVPIRDRLAYVSEYGQKQLGRGRVTSDDLIILPKTACEMARQRLWAARDAG